MMPDPIKVQYVTMIPGTKLFRGIHASDEATALKEGLKIFQRLYGQAPTSVFWSEKNKTLLMEVPNEKRQDKITENTPSLVPEQDAPSS